MGGTTPWLHELCEIEQNSAGTHTANSAIKSWTNVYSTRQTTCKLVPMVIPMSLPVLLPVEMATLKELQSEGGRMLAGSTSGVLQ